MRRKKEKRNFWLNNEIGCMLNLIRQMHDRQGTTTTTHYTFVEIANQMRAFGYPNKSPTQIRRKWFQMKSAYLCYKRGNKDRILLIPEKFRQVIASFVDAEYHGVKTAPIELPDIDPLVSSTVKKAEPKTEPPIEDVKPVPDVKPEVKPIVQKVKVLEQPRVDKQPKRKRKLDGSADGNVTDDEIKRQYFSEQTATEHKFAKLTNRLKSVQKSLQREFSSRQKALMEYEHSLQRERDKALMDYFTSSTEQILSATFSILGQLAMNK